MKKLICRIVKYLIDVLSEVFTWCHTHINAPTLLTATLNPPDIDLAWTDNSDNETGFTIWRSDDGTNFTQIDTVPANTTTYTDTTATPGQDYWYQVQAYNSDNTSDYSNTVSTGIEFTDIHYGLLYNYYAGVDAKKLAPAGFHIPSKTEFDDLITALGGLAGLSEKLREIGSTYWTAPNAGATNSSGLNGRGAGHRIYNTGVFAGINTTCNWLTTTAPFGVYHLEFEVSNTEQLVQFSQNEGVSAIAIKDDSTDPGFVIDYDGNIYPTIKIGSQVWTAKNLIVKHYNDGTVIPELQGDIFWSAANYGAWCYYNNDPSYM